MPTSVHLGPFTYRLTDDAADWAALKKSVRDGCYGYTLHVSATIYLHPEIEPNLKRVIAVHEILHAAAFAGGQHDTSKRDEEAWVAMAAPQLLDALRRTPGLMAWLGNEE